MRLSCRANGKRESHRAGQVRLSNRDRALDGERVLEQWIEADLLKAIGDALPRTIRENLQRIAASVDATVAALLLLCEARRLGTMTLPEIIELVSSQALQQGSSEVSAESVDPR